MFLQVCVEAGSDGQEGYGQEENRVNACRALLDATSGGEWGDACIHGAFLAKLFHVALCVITKPTFVSSKQSEFASVQRCNTAGGRKQVCYHYVY
jgi:hypothetical protein